VAGTFAKSTIHHPQSTISFPYYHLPSLTAAGIIHGFMTRSSDLIVVDKAEREAFAYNLGASDAIILQQVHGDEVHTIAEGERPTEGDGLIVTEKAIVGIVKTADCLPVILSDPAYPMAAVVHAGWRGTVLKITQKAVERMCALGAQRERIEAIIGPGIGPCCYEVGGEVITAFQDAGFGDHIFVRRGDAVFLDLKQANGDLLEGEGITKIHHIDLCTSCRQDLFYSARRTGGTGRQAAFVCLKG
jgi:polyphenol oxidase